MIVVDKVESESASVTNDELNTEHTSQLAIEGKFQVMFQITDGV